MERMHILHMATRPASQVLGGFAQARNAANSIFNQYITHDKDATVAADADADADFDVRDDDSDDDDDNDDEISIET
jgi:hypothetical protein